VPEIVDAVVDLTETGSTLRSHGMVVIATLLTSFTEVVANPRRPPTPSAARPWTTCSPCWSGRPRPGPRC
jgi:ATP phosphoribosyltransferase